MTALWVVLLYFGPPSFFWLLIVVIAGCGLQEFFRMTMAAASPGQHLLNILITILPAVAAIGAGQLARPQLLLGALFLSLFCLILVVLVRFASIGNSLRFLGDTGLAALY